MRRMALAVIGVACASAPATRVSPPETVTIVHAGDAPRRAVRYVFAMGSSADVERTATITTALAFTNTVLEKGAERTETPMIRWIERVSVVGVSGSDAQVTAAVVDGGTTTSWKMSPSGTVSNLATTRAPRSETRGLHVVFPNGEIGVGAVWRIASRERVSGVVWDQIATFQLRDVTETQASVDVELVRTAARQALSVEPTATTTLKSGRGKTTATVLVSLRALTVVGTWREFSEVQLAILQKDLRVTTTTQTTVEHTAKEASEPGSKESFRSSNGASAGTVARGAPSDRSARTRGVP